jgi:hypothetical protein
VLGSLLTPSSDVFRHPAEETDQRNNARDDDRNVFHVA